MRAIITLDKYEQDDENRGLIKFALVLHGLKNFIEGGKVIPP